MFMTKEMRDEYIVSAKWSFTKEDLKVGSAIIHNVYDGYMLEFITHLGQEGYVSLMAGSVEQERYVRYLKMNDLSAALVTEWASNK